MRRQDFEIPDSIIERAEKEWDWAEGGVFGNEGWSKIMAPNRDRIRRVIREVDRKTQNLSPDERREAFREAFNTQFNELQRELLGRMVEEHADQFDDPWTELDHAADILAENTSLKRGQRRQSKDRAAVSTVGLRAAAKVVREWWQSQGHGHGWSYGNYGEEPQLAERVLLQVAQKIDPKTTATHVRSVMKNPD